MLIPGLFFIHTPMPVPAAPARAGHRRAGQYHRGVDRLGADVQRDQRGTVKESKRLDDTYGTGNIKPLATLTRNNSPVCGWGHVREHWTMTKRCARQSRVPVMPWIPVVKPNALTRERSTLPRAPQEQELETLKITACMLTKSGHWSRTTRRRSDHETWGPDPLFRFLGRVRGVGGPPVGKTTDATRVRVHARRRDRGAQRGEVSPGIQSAMGRTPP
jgi:hypothetical protein